MDEVNEFYRAGFSVYDANKKEDFRLRLKVYCTVCDFPGHSHHCVNLCLVFVASGRLVWHARFQPAGECSRLLSLLVHRKEIPWREPHGTDLTLLCVFYEILRNVNVIL